MADSSNTKNNINNATEDINKNTKEDIIDFKVDIEDYLENKEDNKEDNKKDSDIKKKKSAGMIVKTSLKSLLLVFEIFTIIVMSLAIFMLITPNSKALLANTWLGRFVIKIVVTDSDYDNILDADYNRDDTGINKEINDDILDDYTNIALFGLDSRFGELGQGVRSDSIIIVSINEKTKEVRLCSVYRDNWLRIVKPDGTTEYGKVNSAYAFGGPEAAVKTLNQNFDLNIKDYAAVNFYGISKIIDMVGGIDVSITSTEMYWINQYLTETRKVTGLDAPDVTSYGAVHLSGLQATAFCRIRYTTFTDPDGNKYNDDFGRTARQRFVIEQLVSKAKNAGLDTVMDMAEEIFNADQTIVKTSIPYDDLLDMIPVLIDFNITGSAGFPTTYTCPDHSVTGGESSVVAQGFAYNVTKMHQFLFGDYNYKPSTVVQGISDMLYLKTHVEEVTLKEDATED